MEKSSNFVTGIALTRYSYYWRIQEYVAERATGRYRDNFENYRQVSNIRRTKYQHLKDSRTVLRLSLPIPLKPDVKSRMKM